MFQLFHNLSLFRRFSSSCLVSRGSRHVLLDRWVLSLALVGDISDIATITVHGVGNLLETTVGQADVVRSLGGVSVPLLLGAEVVVGVVVLDGELVGVEGRLVWVGGLGTVGRGASGGGKGGSHEGGGSEENLHDCWLCGCA